MQDFLTSETTRKNIQGPPVLDWVLQQLKDRKTLGPEHRAAIKDFLFNDATVRQIIEADDDYAVGRLFTTLSPEVFRNSLDLIADGMRRWENRLFVEGLRLLVELAPEQAMEAVETRLAEGLASSNSLGVPLVFTAVYALDKEKGRLLAVRVFEKLETAKAAPQSVPEPSMIAAFAVRFGLPVVETLLPTLLTAEETALVSADRLKVLHSTLCKYPYFDHITDLLDKETKQTFTTLAPLFEEGAPLKALDVLTYKKGVLSLDRVLDFLRRHCATRDYGPLKLIWPALAAEVPAIVEDEETPLATFYLAIGAESWARTTFDFAHLSAAKAVELLAIDLLPHPAYEALRDRLKECPPDETLGALKRFLPRVRRTYGYHNLLEFVTEVPQAGLVPLLLKDLLDDKFENGREELMSAFVAQGPPARQALLDAWNRLTHISKYCAFECLADLDPDALVDKLLESLPDFRKDDLDAWCYAARAVPDMRIFEALKHELPRERTEVDYIFLTFAILLDEDHPDIPRIRERVAAAEERLNLLRQGSTLEEEVKDFVKLELKCAECGEANFYEVHTIFVDPVDTEQEPYIADELTCLACHADKSLEMTEKARWAVAGELLKMGLRRESMLSSEGPIKLISTRLTDGTPVTPEQALAHYEELVKDEPDNLVAHLALGNCYHNIGHMRKAAKQFRICLGLDPACAEAAHSLAEYLYDQDDFAAAFVVLDGTLQHRKQWRFHRLADSTPKEFIQAYLDFHADLTPERPRLAGSTVFDEPVRVEKKVSPNDPCPCGSRKKYKKCCGGLGLKR